MIAVRLKTGKLLGRRVVARVVAERALGGEVVLVDIALEDDLGVRRYLEIDGDTLDQLDRLAAEEAGNHQFVDVLRERRARRVRGHRVEPECDRNLHPALREQIVGATVLVDLPVHGGRAGAEHLHAIHPDVALAGAWIARDHGRQRDERPGIAGPARLHGQPAQIDLVALEHDLLARAALHELRP